MLRKFFKSKKRVLEGLKLAAQKIWGKYFSFQGGDFRPLPLQNTTTIVYTIYRPPHHAPPTGQHLGVWCASHTLKWPQHTRVAAPSHAGI